MMNKIFSIILIGLIGLGVLEGCSFVDSFKAEKAMMTEKRTEFKIKILKKLSNSEQIASFLKEARDKYKVVDVDDYIYLAWIFKNSKNKVFNSELLHVFVENQKEFFFKQENFILDMKMHHMFNSVHYYVFLKEKGYDDAVGDVLTTYKDIEEAVNTPVDFLNILKEVNSNEYNRVVEKRIKIQKNHNNQVESIKKLIKQENNRNF